MGTIVLPEMEEGLKRSAKYFEDHGYATIKVFNSSESKDIEEFSCLWLYQLLNDYSSGGVSGKPIENYHIWGAQEGVQHAEMLQPQNRHRIPPEELQTLIKTRLLVETLHAFSSSKFTIWDEGLGWLAFRLIRPAHGDGYPLSKKEWGPAKNVISCWIPVIGHSAKETLALVPGSHKQTYPKYLPENSKFTKDEYRFAGNRRELKIIRPELQEGEVIIFHPALLHEEEVTESPITRFNLEIRFMPQEDAI